MKNNTPKTSLNEKETNNKNAITLFKKLRYKSPGNLLLSGDIYSRYGARDFLTKLANTDSTILNSGKLYETFDVLQYAHVITYLYAHPRPESKPIGMLLETKFSFFYSLSPWSRTMLHVNGPVTVVNKQAYITEVVLKINTAIERLYQGLQEVKSHLNKILVESGENEYLTTVLKEEKEKYIAYRKAVAPELKGKVKENNQTFEEIKEQFKRAKVQDLTIMDLPVVELSCEVLKTELLEGNGYLSKAENQKKYNMLSYYPALKEIKENPQEKRSKNSNRNPVRKEIKENNQEKAAKNNSLVKKTTGFLLKKKQSIFTVGNLFKSSLKMKKLGDAHGYNLIPFRGVRQTLLNEPFSTLAAEVYHAKQIQHFYTPFQQKIIKLDTPKNSNKPLFNVVKAYLVNLVLISRAHNKILEQYSNPSKLLLRNLQLYINEHCFYALITFRNAVVEAKSSSYGLTRSFSEVKNSLRLDGKISLKELKTEESASAAALTLLARSGSLGKKASLSGNKINKLCARPRSNPRAGNSNPKKKDEMTYYVNTLNGAPSVENFKKTPYFTEISSNKLTEKIEPSPQLKNIEIQPGKLNSTKNKRKKKKPKVSPTPVPAIFKKVAQQPPQSIAIKIQPGELKNKNSNSTNVMMYNEIVHETNTKTFRFGTKYRSDTSLLCLISPFKLLILDLENQSNNSNVTSSLKKELGIYLKNVLTLKKQLHKTLEKYEKCESGNIDLDIIYFFSAKAFHALLSFRRAILKKELTHKFIAPAFKAIQESTCIFYPATAAGEEKDTEYLHHFMVKKLNPNIIFIRGKNSKKGSYKKANSYIMQLEIKKTQDFFDNVSKFIDTPECSLEDSLCKNAIELAAKSSQKNEFN